MPRGKTFTGCWTCRERRLKCDEVRPKCNKCSSKGLVCAGYNSRLHWLDPNNLSPTEDSHSTTRKGIQRRRLLPANGIQRLSDDQLDSLLCQIDEDVAGSQQCFRGPFGVLPLLSTSSERATYPPSLTQGISSSAPVTISHLSTTSPISDTALTTGTTSSNVPCSGGRPADTASFLNTEVRILLNHYRANVLPFFSVLDNMHTPWRVLHFPKVLQAACEHELDYITAGPSSILMYAILSISAYSLQNSEFKRHNRQISNHWEEVATHYKGEALKLLQAHIASLSDDRTEFDYHELLAAILSMVTIDVMCGDTRTCAVHLKACETLINAHVEASPNGLSTLSEGLHTTFIYLQVMQLAATASSPEVPEVNGSAASPSSPENPQSPTSVRGPPVSPDYNTFVYLGDTKHVSLASFSSEMIYGFPIRLLFYLRDTIQLTNHHNFSPTLQSSRSPPSSVELALTKLQEEILDWPIEEIIAKYKSAPLQPGNLKILEHYTRAFHTAMIIYFLDRVHKSGQKTLQKHVRSVIRHLEQVEEAKQEHGIVAGPLLWPAFIAASRATDSATQNRFIDWLEGSDQMGVGTSKATIDLLKDIWSKVGSFYPPRQHAACVRGQHGLVLT